MQIGQKNDVYVVGCGPSLKGFDWSLLQGKNVVAVNMALAHLPDATYFVTADSWFARYAFANNFWNSKAIKVLVMRNDHKRFVSVRDTLKHYVRISPVRFDGQIGFTESEFATGQNSGFCGLQFAALMQPMTIHLLGIDLNTIGGDHFHTAHPLGVDHLEEYYQHFVRALGILQQHGIRVVSHSPTSRLNKHIPFELMEDS